MVGGRFGSGTAFALGVRRFGLGGQACILGGGKLGSESVSFFLGAEGLVGMAALASRVTELSARGEELQVCKAPGRLGKAVDPAFYTDAETFFGRASASKPCPKSSF